MSPDQSGALRRVEPAFHRPLLKLSQSHAAAQSLGMTGQGVAKVKLDVVQ